MIKKYVNIILATLVIALFIGGYCTYSNNQKLRDELSLSKSNEKAFIVENSGLKDQNRAFQ